MSFPIRYRDELTGKEFEIFGASSILHPKDSTVLFIGRKYKELVSSLLGVDKCIVFVLGEIEEPPNLDDKHCIIRCGNPRKEYGRFLQEHQADKRSPTSFRSISQSLISNDSHIAKHVTIGPFVFIDRDVEIDEGTVIHSGVRILPGTKVGKNCEIHENTVIGTVGLAYEDDQIIPQLGGIHIYDNVAIGASCIIARGAIDDTVIKENCKIDAKCFISHNNHLGTGVTIIGGTTLFGSVTLGDHAYISGNSVIKNGVTIGFNTVVGMGSVVTQSYGPNITIFGNPAIRL